MSSYKDYFKSVRSEKEILNSWGSQAEVEISIICTSYNQVSYVEDAILGFLSQETKVPFEIIIHDDASKDGTREIIERYLSLYPNIFVPVLQFENIYSKGRSPLVECFHMAKGKYLAICEGDDFWICPDKLQSQYDLMEVEKSFSFCCHNANVYFVDSEIVEEFNSTLISNCYFTKDLMLRDWFIPTASLFCRRDFIVGKIPDWFGGIRSQDLTIEIILSMSGAFRYEKSAMSVYRKNAIGSLSSKGGPSWEYLKNRIYLFLMLKKILPFRLKVLAWVDIAKSVLKIVYAKYILRGY